MVNTRHRITLGLVVLLLASCSSAAEPTATVARPTVTPIPVFQFVAPTNPPQFATLSVRTPTVVSGEVTPDPAAVERGRDRYVALGCGTCHGDSGEGTDDGSALTTFSMSEADFISLMRSGGSIGAQHQFSTNRLSTSGGSDLYHYLQSLSDS